MYLMPENNESLARNEAAEAPRIDSESPTSGVVVDINQETFEGVRGNTDIRPREASTRLGKEPVLMDSPGGDYISDAEISDLANKMLDGPYKRGGVYSFAAREGRGQIIVNKGLERNDIHAQVVAEAKSNSLNAETVRAAFDLDYSSPTVMLRRDTEDEIATAKRAYVEAARVRREATGLNYEVGDNFEAELNKGVKDIVAWVKAGKDPENSPISDRFEAEFDDQTNQLTIFHKQNRVLYDRQPRAKIVVTVNRYSGEDYIPAGISMTMADRDGKDPRSFNFDPKQKGHAAMLLPYLRPPLESQTTALQDNLEAQQTVRGVPGISQATMDKMRAERDNPANIIARLESNEALTDNERQELERLQGVLNDGKTLLPLDFEYLRVLQERLDSNPEVPEREEAELEGGGILQSVKELLTGEAAKRRAENQDLMQEVAKLGEQLTAQGEQINAQTKAINDLTAQIEHLTKELEKTQELLQKATSSADEVNEDTSSQGPDAQEEPVPAAPNPNNDSDSTGAEAPKPTKEELQESLENQVGNVLKNAGPLPEDTSGEELPLPQRYSDTISRAQRLMQMNERDNIGISQDDITRVRGLLDTLDRHRNSDNERIVEGANEVLDLLSRKYSLVGSENTSPENKQADELSEAETQTVPESTT